MSLYKLMQASFEMFGRTTTSYVEGALQNTSMFKGAFFLNSVTGEYHLLTLVGRETVSGGQTVHHEKIGDLTEFKQLISEIYGDKREYDGSKGYFEGYHSYQHNIAARAIEDKFIYKLKKPDYMGCEPQIA